MTSKMRATKGGEYGKNGEWYNGGEFLPSTELEKQAKLAKLQKKVRRVEIARREWVDEIEGKKSIYQTYGGIFLQFNWNTGFATTLLNEQKIAHYNVTEERVQKLADRYNNGERWMSREETI